MKHNSKRPSGRSSKLAGSRLLQRLLDKAQPSFQVGHIAEPRLIFGGQGRCEDPKTGIALFGPAAVDRGGRNVLRLGIIGNGDTVQGLRNWIERARGVIKAGLNPKGRPYDPILAPQFPGFDSQPPFDCRIDIDARHVETLTASTIERAISYDNYVERVRAMVQVVANKLEALADKEPAPDVVVVAMPKIVEQSCGPEARKGLVRRRKLTKVEKALRRRKRESEETGQMFFDFADPFKDEEPTEPDKFRDFHNALKAWAMRSELPTQLLWESTLNRGRGTEDPATTAWNFFTALYYKAGNLPWELDFAASRTCFVGITFFREGPDPDAATRTCLAQAFSETGEGLVLRGEQVTWDTSRDKKPHLSESAAAQLMERVLETYHRHFDDRPRRVVVHKTSRYWPEELAGFKRALSDVHSHDFLAIERRGIRFLRLGSEPPVRGTLIHLARRDYLLYTRGYVPFLRLYPGMRIPNPLEVVEHHGDTSAERVCSEIMALTKLNWNTSAFASADPITIGFSKQVATILKELPDGVEPMERYRFYI